jgi:hypothetical protein
MRRRAHATDEAHAGAYERERRGRTEGAQSEGISTVAGQPCQHAVSAGDMLICCQHCGALLWMHRIALCWLGLMGLESRSFAVVSMRNMERLLEALPAGRRRGVHHRVTRGNHCSSSSWLVAIVARGPRGC